MLPELISSNFVNMINLSPTDCFFISSIISETLFFLTSLPDMGEYVFPNLENKIFM